MSAVVSCEACFLSIVQILCPLRTETAHLIVRSLGCSEIILGSELVVTGEISRADACDGCILSILWIARSLSIASLRRLAYVHHDELLLRKLLRLW